MRRNVIIAGLVFISVVVVCHYLSFYIYMHPSQEAEVELPDGSEHTIRYHSETELDVAELLFNIGIFPLVIGIIVLVAGISMRKKETRNVEDIEGPKARTIEDIIREQDPGRKKCRQCYGSGKCNVCEGTGVIISGVAKKEECNVCKGSGLCPDCCGYGE